MFYIKINFRFMAGDRAAFLFPSGTKVHSFSPWCHSSCGKKSAQLLLFRTTYGPFNLCVIFNHSRFFRYVFAWVFRHVWFRITYGTLFRYVSYFFKLSFKTLLGFLDMYGFALLMVHFSVMRLIFLSYLLKTFLGRQLLFSIYLPEKKNIFWRA